MSDSLLIFRLRPAVQISEFQTRKSLKRFLLTVVMYLTSLLILISLMALPAQASFCKSINNQKVCILRIDRSAKKYWEYQVQLSVDQVTQPVAIYNCLENWWLPPNGRWQKFTNESVSAMACSLFRR